MTHKLPWAQLGAPSDENRVGGAFPTVPQESFQMDAGGLPSVVSCTSSGERTGAASAKAGIASGGGRNLTPHEMVTELNRHVIGQDDAKRVLAVAFRDRWRRLTMTPELRAETTPSNVLLMGPTGVGKTQIARRLAGLLAAPFVKVEATKYTQTGVVGADPSSMVVDLAREAHRLVLAEHKASVADQALQAAEDELWGRLYEAHLLPEPPPPPMMRPGPGGMTIVMPRPSAPPSFRRISPSERSDLRSRLAAGMLRDKQVSLSGSGDDSDHHSSSGIPHQLVDFFTGGGQGEGPTLFAPAALERLQEAHAQRLIDHRKVHAEAVRRAEELGVIFIDEIDKLGASRGFGADFKGAGVQQELLPIVEGCTVDTPLGPIRTDHILFIAAGAFSVSAPEDLLPELQGRFPEQARLSGLDTEMLYRILVEPERSLVKQAQGLLAQEGVTVDFTPAALREIATTAERLNRGVGPRQSHAGFRARAGKPENTGARRLISVLRHVLRDVSFHASEKRGQSIQIDDAFVRARCASLGPTTEGGRAAGFR